MATDWTDRELATLAALAETFVRGDAPRRARLTADVLERAADPSQVRQLRLVLRVLESRVANLALGGRPSGFAAMSPAARERYLLGWSTSRLGLRRTAFGSLRKLMTFIAYADPGDEEPNPHHAAIGYVPELPPVAADPTPIVPFALPFGDRPADADDPMIVDADVVVVGSGAGGGVVAAALAAAGRSVVVLEAGPFVDEASMPHDEMDAFARLYLNHGLLSTWDGAVTMLAGSAVGGGTLVNWMTTIGAPPALRERWRREHGIDDLADGEAWTVDVATLERELAVSEVAHPPPKDEAILRGAERLGWEAAPIQRDALACDDCGSCPFGCRRGSKRSGIRVHLADAYGAGARIVSGVMVTRVLLEGGRAVGVEGNAILPDPETGEPMADRAVPGGVRIRRLVVRAPQVVIAAGALRTPAVLEGSGLDHPAIGRYLRIHPVPVVAGRMPGRIDMWRGPMQGARSLEFAEDEPGRNGYVIESAPGHPGLLALALPWEGTEAHAAIMADARSIAPFLAVTRDGGEGRTTLTRAGRVRIDYRLDATGVATLRHATVRMARLARAAGAVEILAAATPPVWFRGDSGLAGAADAADAAEADLGRFERRLEQMDFGANRGSVFSAHQMGTARMGADPRDHACDLQGRLRRSMGDDRPVAGLYVADGSLFPTGLGVNPTLTIMALARRVARTVLAEG